MRKIAVIGATGMLGLPVATELLSAGFDVTALARNAERAALLLPQRTNVVDADVRNRDQLRVALTGQDALYLNLSVIPGSRPTDFHTENAGLIDILSAATAAGIKRIAYLSALVVNDRSTNWWVLDLWRSAIARIKSSGIPYTIFLPSNFMETIPTRHISGPVVLVSGRSRSPHYWIAGSDFGQQVARSFEIGQAANREYYVQGPEPMTYSEAAHRFAASSRRTLIVANLPPPLLWIGALFSRRLTYTATINSIVLRYPEKFLAEATWRDLGEPKLRIEDFTRRFEQDPPHS